MKYFHSEWKWPYASLVHFKKAFLTWLNGFWDTSPFHNQHTWQKYKEVDRYETQCSNMSQPQHTLTVKLLAFQLKSTSRSLFMTELQNIKPNMHSKAGQLVNRTQVDEQPNSSSVNSNTVFSSLRFLLKSIDKSLIRFFICLISSCISFDKCKPAQTHK